MVKALSTDKAFLFLTEIQVLNFCLFQDKKKFYFPSCAPKTFCNILVVLIAGVFLIPLSF